jgi:hypothetical protein
MRACLMVGLLLVGCGESHAGSQPPIAREDFCSRWAEAVCAAQARCDCASVIATCVSSYARSCEVNFFGDEVLAGIASGDVVYDGLAAAAQIERYEGVAICADHWGALGFEIRDIFTQGGVIRGTLEAGESCDVRNDLISECREGICMGGQCIGFVDEGAECDATHRCIDLDRALTDATLDALFGFLERNGDIWLRCEIPAGSPSGTCAPLLPAGAPCASSADCESLSCDATCRVLLPNGAECASRGQCASRYCEIDLASPICADQALPGAPCTTDSGCTSDSCDGSVCVSYICDG